MSGALGATAGWRVAARLARREVRRRPGRSALVAALIAVPVAGMFVGVVLLRTGDESAAERWRYEFGRADAVVHEDTLVDPGPLPDGSRSVDYSVTYRIVGTAGGALCRCTVTDVPFEPLTDGIVEVTSGRAPAASDEILLSRDAADALRTDLGERVELSRPVDLAATVVGIGNWSASLGQSLVVVGPGASLPTDHDYAARHQLVDLPDDLSPAELAAWESTAGAHALSPDLLGQPESTIVSNDASAATVSIRWTWVAGAAGFTVLGIVIAAAFAAGARRQLATLGQLAANGGTPALLRRVLFLQGTVTGLLGSAAGLALGALVLVGLRPHATDLLGHTVSGWDIRLVDVGPSVPIAVLAATVAALVPAFGASRVSVLTALAGRRPPGRVSARRTATGLVMSATGLALLGGVAYAAREGVSGARAQVLTVLALVGPVLLLLGVCTAAPAYLTVLRPLASTVRGPWRLAARSLFRQRTRTSALVSAICAISAVAVAGAAIGLAFEREERARGLVNDLNPDLVLLRSGAYTMDEVEVAAPREAFDEVAGQAAVVLPEADRYDIAEAVEPGTRVKPWFSPRDHVPTDPDLELGGDDGNGYGDLLPMQATIVDDAFRGAYDVDDPTQRLLDRYGAVWIGAGLGRATVDAVVHELPDPEVFQVAPVESRRASFEVGVLGPESSHGFGSRGELLLTPAKAAELGFEAVPSEVALRTPQPLTAAQRDSVEQLALIAEAAYEDAVARSPDGIVESSVWVDYDHEGLTAGPGFIETAPAAVALVIVLFVVAVGLALAAVETRDERDVLAVLGAAPRTVRRASGCKAYLLTALGALIAVPVGLLPVAVYGRIDNSDLPFVVPWRTMGLLVLALPVVTAALTSLATRCSLRLRPIRISTATFD